MTSDNRNSSDTEYPSSGSRKQKIRGAAEVIHGVGDNLRGRLMSAVDSSTKTGGTRPEVERGRQEVEQGMAKITGGPGAAHPSSSDHATSGTRGSSAPSAAVAQEGNALGPTSAVDAGFNASPTTAVAEAPYQSQYSSGGAGSEGTPSFTQGSNDRDFHSGGAGQSQQPPSMPQQGMSPGPAPDRSTLPGDPQRLG
ncbi:hypothetical protein PYCCODRAFT_1427566 [Trametes coccinea BRFM310]|uniref:Uncharacterized protein n=1 Tax=Trametes coccinea (strain BRFM310) TaxID=1353009 RepID=A0A1Y2IE09_TRAC3|nr:hypothetical protein PYCCODRAFT_1427566 [Trametes coccinea BRFM310]